MSKRETVELLTVNSSQTSKQQNICRKTEKQNELHLHKVSRINRECTVVLYLLRKTIGVGFYATRTKL